MWAVPPGTVREVTYEEATLVVLKGLGMFGEKSEQAFRRLSQHCSLLQPTVPQFSHVLWF